MALPIASMVSSFLSTSVFPALTINHHDVLARNKGRTDTGSINSETYQFVESEMCDGSSKAAPMLPHLMLALPCSCHAHVHSVGLSCHA